MKLIWIHCGLVTGYPAKMAAFVREERLDKMDETGGDCRKFYGVVGKPQYRVSRCEVAVNSVVRRINGWSKTNFDHCFPRAVVEETDIVNDP